MCEMNKRSKGLKYRNLKQSTRTHSGLFQLLESRFHKARKKIRLLASTGRQDYLIEIPKKENGIKQINRDETNETV